MPICNLAVEVNPSNFVHFICTWDLVDHGLDDGFTLVHPQFQYLDIKLVPIEPGVDVFQFPDPSEDRSCAFLYDAGQPSRFPLPLAISCFLKDTGSISAQLADGQPQAISIKFAIPTSDGYIIRSDFFERRLEGIIPRYASRVVSFLSPRQKVTPFLVPMNMSSSPTNEAASTATPHTTDVIHGLLSSSLGVILLRIPTTTSTPTPPLHPVQSTVNSDLTAILDSRLPPSFRFLTSDPPPPKRLVLIEARRNPEMAHRLLLAAYHLGISLVVFDQPSHWLADDSSPYAYLREQFVAVDIEVDEGFVDRVVHAVEGLRAEGLEVNGLMTVSDARLVSVAKACEILGLPSSSSKSLEVAGDKYATRVSEMGCQEHISQNPREEENGVFRVFSVEDLKDLLIKRKQKGKKELEYPLIVKPCLGWGSQAVSKACNEAELVFAVGKASTCHQDHPQKRTDVVIEPYIDGPEVDANFVLRDGEILFFEVLDDFPSPGDGDEKDNFVETVVVYPSGLPGLEKSAIRDALHESILRQGFRTGVFHCEARVQHSRMEYQTGVLDDEESRKVVITDLQYKTGDEKVEDVRVYLLEINARPPGYLATASTQYICGVDYYAQQMLYAIGSEGEDRFMTLAIPFAHMQATPENDSDLQPDHFALLVAQEGNEAGIMETEDAASELVRRHPDIAPQLPLYSSVIKRGDQVFGRNSPHVSMMAWFLIAASNQGQGDMSRKECLILAEKVQKLFLRSYELREM